MEFTERPSLSYKCAAKRVNSKRSTTEQFVGRPALHDRTHFGCGNLDRSGSLLASVLRLIPVT